MWIRCLSDTGLNVIRIIAALLLEIVDKIAPAGSLRCSVTCDQRERCSVSSIIRIKFLDIQSRLKFYLYDLGELFRVDGSDF